MYDNVTQQPDPPETDGKSGKKKHAKKESKVVTLTRKKLVAIMLICILLAGALSFGCMWAADNLLNGGSSSSSASTTGFDLKDATGSKMTVQEISDKVSDSIVDITTESVSTDQWIQNYVTEGAGSGIIIKSNGYILTNNHVIEDANSIYVTLSNDKKYKATVVGADSQSDLAVLKISATGLTPVTMGKSSQLNVGDLAVIIGNPLGELGGTVSAGIISALDREVTIDDMPMTLIQTDASVNPGDSGGGMFNQYGQLVGIIVAKSSGTDVEGIGFAIPIDSATDVISSLIKNGKVEGRASTGMSYIDVTSEEEATQYGLSQTGVYIKQVSGTNAKNAGFESGDLVYKVAGTKIDSISTLKSIIMDHKAGDKIKYVVVRNGTRVDITFTLSESNS